MNRAVRSTPVPIAGAGVEFPRKESRRRFQDRDVLTKPPVPGIQPADLRVLFAGLTVTATGVDISLHDPTTQRLSTDAFDPDPAA